MQCNALAMQFKQECNIYGPNKRYIVSNFLNFFYDPIKTESWYFLFYCFYPNQNNIMYSSIKHAGQFGMFNLHHMCQCKCIQWSKLKVLFSRDYLKSLKMVFHFCVWYSANLFLWRVATSFWQRLILPCLYLDRGKKKPWC